MRLPLLVAHRGGAREAPENSLEAIAHARRSGADGIELDVRLSADGVPVVFHDSDLRRLGGSRRRVDESGLHALVGVELFRRAKRFEPTRIPTLDEALAAVGPLAPVQLELKAEGEAEPLARRTLDAVRRAGLAEAVELTSFDRATIAVLRRLAPELPAGLVLDHPPADDAWLELPLASLSLELGRAGWAARARARGVRVAVWTENDPRSLPAWAALGVDALITDRPERFAAARRELEAR